ncbi:MAG: hypothetical protein ACYC5Y_14905 [Symbiobacteriia bacterium]
MTNSFRIEPIGRSGLARLLHQYRQLRNDAFLPESNSHLESVLLERESVDLDHSFFAWLDTADADPVGFGLLGVRGHGDQLYASVRALGGKARPAAIDGAPLGAIRPDDPRPELLRMMVDAARKIGARTISAEGATAPDDLTTQPPASLLQRAGFSETKTLLGFEATREGILADPVYLQIGLHHVGPEDLAEFDAWLAAADRVLPWPLQAESFQGTSFPDMTFILIASGFGAGYLTVTDPQLERAELLQAWVLPDLRRQQVAKGALQEVLSRYDRLETLTVPPVVPETDKELITFLEAVGFRQSGARRLLMEARLK